MNRMAGEKPGRDWDEVARLAFGPVVVLVLALLIGIIVAAEARAHDAPSGWPYPNGCCHGTHCSVLPREEVQITPEGYYVITTDELILFSEANASPDDEYHYCSERSRHRVNLEGELSYHHWLPLQEGDTVRDSTSDNRFLTRSITCFWAPEGSS